MHLGGVHSALGGQLLNLTTAAGELGSGGGWCSEADVAGRLLQLDALRGVACLLVLVAHLRGVPLLRMLPDGGPTGVGIFFALSGFVVTRSLLSPGMTLREFYLRRAARILPLYFLVLGLLAVCWPGTSLLWAAGFAFNLFHMSGSEPYFAVSEKLPPVGHFWSLCVEEHFYWVWPCLILGSGLPALRSVTGNAAAGSTIDVGSRRRLSWLLVLLIAATPGVAIGAGRWLVSAGVPTADVQGLLERWTIANFAALALGALSALHVEWLSRASFAHIPRSTVCGAGLLAIGCGGWWCCGLLLPDECRGFCHQLGCSGVLLLVLHQPSLGRITPLVWTGAISYGLYLFHLPLYAYGGVLGDSTATLWQAVSVVTATWLAALISWHFLEQPVMEQARQLPNKWRWIGIGATWGTVATFVFVCGSVLQTMTFTPESIVEKPLPRDEIETVVIGTSHGYMGIATAELPRAYNLAYSAQDVWYNAQVLSQVTEELPNLRRVIFTISPFTYRWSNADRPEDRWKEAVYFHGGGIESRTAGRPLSRWLLAGHGTELRDIGRKLRLVDDPRRGWSPLPQKAVDAAAAAAVARFHASGSADRVEDNRTLLADAITRCQARGVESVLVTTPLLACYREQFDPVVWQEFEAETQQLVQATGVRYWNFAADGRFDVADFYDGDHLNGNGARKFTALLAAELKRPNELAVSSASPTTMTPSAEGQSPR